MNRRRWTKRPLLTAGMAGLSGWSVSDALAGNSGWLGSWWAPIEAKNYEEAWGMNPARWKKDAWGLHFNENGKVRVQLITSTAIGNIFWPGEKPELTLQFVNLTDQALAAKGTLHLYQYGMTIGMEDMWKQNLFRIAECGTTPVEVTLPLKGFQNIVVKPSLPQKFGAYAMIVALEGQDCLLGALLTRTMPAKPERVQYPVMSLDESDPASLQRLGIKAVRMQIDFIPNIHGEYASKMAGYKRKLEALHQHNVTVLAMFQGSGVPQPFGARGGHYDKEGKKGGIWDAAWLPKAEAR